MNIATSCLFSYEKSVFVYTCHCACDQLFSILFNAYFTYDSYVVYFKIIAQKNISTHCICLRIVSLADCTSNNFRFILITDKIRNCSSLIILYKSMSRYFSYLTLDIFSSFTFTIIYYQLSICYYLLHILIEFRDKRI